MSANNNKKNKATFSDLMADKYGRVVFFITVGLIIAVIIMGIIGICTSTTTNSASGDVTVTTTTKSPEQLKQELLADFNENSGDYHAAVSEYLSTRTTTAAAQ